MYDQLVVGSQTDLASTSVQVKGLTVNISGTKTVDSPLLSTLTSQTTTRPMTCRCPWSKKIVGVPASRRGEEMKMIFRHKTLKPQDMNID